MGRFVCLFTSEKKERAREIPNVKDKAGFQQQIRAAYRNGMRKGGTRNQARNIRRLEKSEGPKMQAFSVKKYLEPTETERGKDKAGFQREKRASARNLKVEP